MSLLCRSANRYPSPISPPRENEKDADIEIPKMRDREKTSNYNYHDSPLTYARRDTPHNQHHEHAEGGAGWFDRANPEALSTNGHSTFAGGYHQQSQVEGQGHGQVQTQGRWGWGGPDWQFQLPPATPPPETETETGSGPGQASWYANARQQYSCWNHGAGFAPLHQQQLTPYYYTEPPAKLNATVPAFVPESVSTVSMMNRLSGVNKRVRYNRQQDIATAAANALLQNKSRPKAQKPQRPQTSARKFSHSNPRLHVMERPLPTVDYLHRAAQQPQALDISRPLLVILDLNGTLLYRNKELRSTHTERPHLKEFLDYLFSNHKVMVWSSARPANVQRMCNALFTRDQRKQLVAMWARDTLRLDNFAYNEKVQVYKQLSWVWNNPIIQATSPLPGVAWSQANTVLIDDSIDKAASEPHNITLIEEFEARKDQMEADVLGQVAFYLDTLRSQQDASAYMRSQPFVYDPSYPLPAQSEAETSGGEEGGVSLSLA